uniref:PBC domain-containing protein n=1 Tax=Monopterus albus TaxID=43700 RepID=A0A3Q3IK92_MONAL
MLEEQSSYGDDERVNKRSSSPFNSCADVSVLTKVVDQQNDEPALPSLGPCTSLATPAGDSKLPVGVSVSVCLSLCAGPVIDQWPVYGVTQRLILSLIPGLLTSPCMQACSELTGHVKNLLREQSRMRPISPKQTEQMVTIIHRKFSAVQLQLKQSTCEAVMILRSRFLDYLLSSVFNCCNRFFFISTFMLLYAVNQVEFLVISFLLSSLKVANWFGNKRIRYKKNIGKFQEDA